jgi:hypothetical protein
MTRFVWTLPVAVLIFGTITYLAVTDMISVWIVSAAIGISNVIGFSEGLSRR